MPVVSVHFRSLYYTWSRRQYVFGLSVRPCVRRFLGGNILWPACLRLLVFRVLLDGHFNQWQSCCGVRSFHVIIYSSFFHGRQSKLRLRSGAPLMDQFKYTQRCQICAALCWVTLSLGLHRVANFLSLCANMTSSINRKCITYRNAARGWPNHGHT